ncbi:hypothetical protein NC652_033479 [Populus alba x Populus x berolinensis]|nr:hypothetical protein NC652_033479 [Populus alba x Populus x berolinensis]
MGLNPSPNICQSNENPYSQRSFCEQAPIMALHETTFLSGISSNTWRKRSYCSHLPYLEMRELEIKTLRLVPKLNNILTNTNAEFKVPKTAAGPDNKREGIMNKAADHDIPEEETGGWGRREDGAGIRNGVQRGVMGNEVGGKKVKVVGEVTQQKPTTCAIEGGREGNLLSLRTNLYDESSYTWFCSMILLGIFLPTLNATKQLNHEAKNIQRQRFQITTNSTSSSVSEQIKGK